MFKVICWLLIFGGIYYAWQAGWFNGINEYFSESARQARQEKWRSDHMCWYNILSHIGIPGG